MPQLIWVFASKNGMRLVQDWAEIRQNLLTLDRYRASAERRVQDFFRATIGDGFCFVVCDVSGRLIFGPSRFIGYQHNNRRKHQATRRKSGIDTNRQIQRLLSATFEPSPSREATFIAFCKRHGIAPRANKRKYIHYGEGIVPTDAELIQDDIEEINNSRHLGSTQKKQLVLARLGQGDFRRRIRRYWKRCLVTKCGVQILLRASHIKPWRACSNEERLDGFNGLLLAPHIDAAFDRGLISFDGRGRILLSRRLPPAEARHLGLPGSGHVTFTLRHQKYLEYHRKHVFLG